jgi:hypothetical protein
MPRSKSACSSILLIHDTSCRIEGTPDPFFVLPRVLLVAAGIATGASLMRNNTHDYKTFLHSSRQESENGLV